jgi:hypothetical protein
MFILKIDFYEVFFVSIFSNRLWVNACAYNLTPKSYLKDQTSSAVRDPICYYRYMHAVISVLSLKPNMALSEEAYWYSVISVLQKPGNECS